MCPRTFVEVVATTTQRTQRARAKDKARASSRDPGIRARRAGIRSSLAAEVNSAGAAVVEVVALIARAATTEVLEAAAAAVDDVEEEVASRTTTTVSSKRPRYKEIGSKMIDSRR